MSRDTTKGDYRNREINRRRLLAGAGAIGATALAGCSGGDDETGDGGDGGSGGDSINVLTTYTSPASKRSYDVATDQFKSEYGDSEVQMGFSNWEEVYSKLVQAANTGEWPEMVMFVNNDILLLLDDQEFAEDPETVIDPVTDAAGDIADNVPETHYKAKDGSFYGLLTNNQTPVSWYRTDVMEEIGMDSKPTTWNQELEYVRASDEADNGLSGTSLSTARNTYMSDMFHTRLRSAGGTIFDPEKNVTLDSQVTRDVLEHYKDLTQYAAPGAETFSFGEAYTNFATDSVASCLYWGRTTINVRDQTPEILDFVVNENPAKPGTDQDDPNDNTSLMSGDGAQLISESANKEAARNWISTYLKPEIFVDEYMSGTPGNTTPIFEDHQEPWNNLDFWDEVNNGEQIRDKMVESARTSNPPIRAGEEFPAFPELNPIVRTPVMSGPASEYYADSISLDDAATEMAERAEQTAAEYGN